MGRTDEGVALINDASAVLLALARDFVVDSPEKGEMLRRIIDGANREAVCD